ncbi:MAG: RNA-binding protein [Firmicutes bacterium]|nr:RNA-binding protein [Bacillota bacterium]
MDTDEILIAQTEDRIRRAYDRNMMTSGDFLDMHQKKVLTDRFMTRSLPVKMVFYGGYADAERCIPVFLPEYIEWSGDYDDVPWDLKELVSVIRVSAPKGGRRLSHRDYLGSLLSLGIDRSVTGDILVREDSSGGSSDGMHGGSGGPGIGADIIVMSDMAEFIEMNYTKAGRTDLSVSRHSIDELYIGEIKTVKKRDTVASLRLDSVVSSAFSLSRAKAAEQIRRGLVSVNSMEAVKPDMEIDEGDKIVLRGSGKALLSEVGGRSRKDRICITFDIYV